MFDKAKPCIHLTLHGPSNLTTSTSGSPIPGGQHIQRSIHVRIIPMTASATNKCGLRLSVFFINVPTLWHQFRLACRNVACAFWCSNCARRHLLDALILHVSSSLRNAVNRLPSE